LHNCARGKKKKKTLFVCDENLGMSFLVQETKGNHSVLNIEITIEVGDDLIKELVDDQSSISFIKIDVKGFEADALNGLRQTIIKHRPVIAIELNFLSIKDPAEDALKVLLDLGYKDFYILESAHSIQNRFLNFAYRLLFGDRKVITKLEKLEAMNYQQLFCVSAG
jgi:hypothetical protein